MACSQDGGCTCRWRSCTLVQACRALAANQGRSHVWSTNSRPVRRMDGGSTEWPGVQALFRSVIASRYPACARTRHRPYTPEERKTVRERISYWMGDRDYLVASNFQHIAVSDAWLVRLERWMSTVAVQLQGSGGPETWWAFPSALRKLKTGMRYYANNFNLDRSIRAAQIPVRQ